jgi:DNA-binding CsgD family transcriptional regulator
MNRTPLSERGEREMKKAYVLEDVKERCLRGETEMEIALGLGLSLTSVKKWLKELGLKAKKSFDKRYEEEEEILRGFVVEGLTIKEISEKWGKPYGYVWKSLRRLKLKTKRVYTLPPEKIERKRIVKEMREEGKTLQEIGDIIGLTREGVRMTLKKQGITGKWQKDADERALFIEAHGESLLVEIGKGRSLNAICEELNVKSNFLRKVLEDMGCGGVQDMLREARNKEMKEKRARGVSVAELAREYSLNENYLRVILNKE